MSGKPIIDYERPKLTRPSGLRAWHYVVASLVAVAAFACGVFLMSLLRDSLPGPAFAPQLIKNKHIDATGLVAGIIVFKVVLNGFKPKERWNIGGSHKQPPPGDPPPTGNR